MYTITSSVTKTKRDLLGQHIQDEIMFYRLGNSLILLFILIYSNCIASKLYNIIYIYTNY